MTLLAGDALDPKNFFESGNPQVQGSSFDLTIGSIFDHQGKRVDGPFILKPGHMVQVVSAEVMKLSDRITGHVTYKTTLTRRGIWALTVGIVDPGWHGPIATTLLNFSRVDHAVAEGDPFLRVSFFEHSSIPPERLRKAPALEVYHRDVQKIAATTFPITFLDTKQIADAAVENVLKRIRNEALAWVVLIAVVFTSLQIIATWFTGSGRPTMSEIEALKDKIEVLQGKLVKIEQPSSTTSVAAPQTLPSPTSTARPLPPSSPVPLSTTQPPSQPTDNKAAPRSAPAPTITPQNPAK